MQQRRLDAGADDEQIGGGVEQRFEEASQRRHLLVVEIVHLIEAEEERLPGAESQARQGDEDLLDLLIVGQADRLVARGGRRQAQASGLGRVEVIAGQPAHGQDGDAVIVPLSGDVSRLEEAQQHGVGGTIDKDGTTGSLPINEAAPGPFDPCPGRPHRRIVAERLMGERGGEAVERRAVEACGPPAGEGADDGTEERARQTVGTGLEIVQVDERSLSLHLGPASQPGQNVALADARLAPEDGPQTAPGSASLARQGGQALEGGAVDGIDVGGGWRRAADAVVGERIGGRDMGEKGVRRGAVGEMGRRAGRS